MMDPPQKCSGIHVLLLIDCNETCHGMHPLQVSLPPYRRPVTLLMGMPHSDPGPTFDYGHFDARTLVAQKWLTLVIKTIIHLEFVHAFHSK